MDSKLKVIFLLKQINGERFWEIDNESDPVSDFKEFYSEGTWTVDDKTTLNKSGKNLFERYCSEVSKCEKQLEQQRIIFEGKLAIKDQEIFELRQELAETKTELAETKFLVKKLIAFIKKDYESRGLVFNIDDI